MHEREILPALRSGVDDVGRRNNARLKEPGVNEAVLFSREDVQPDIEVIPG
jgi:hypothetical protein